MSNVDESYDVNKIAMEFSKLFYDAIDRRRNTLSKLYKKDAVLMWNDSYIGGAHIQSFYKDMPSTSHKVISIDAQPMLSIALEEGQKGIMVQINGCVTIRNKSPRRFTDAFIITCECDKWKINKETFRL